MGAAVVRGLRPVAGGINVLRPDIGVKPASPAGDMGIGVNMVRFAPGIRGKLGTVPIPTTDQYML